MMKFRKTNRPQLSPCAHEVFRFVVALTVTLAMTNGTGCSSGKSSSTDAATHLTDASAPTSDLQADVQTDDQQRVTDDAAQQPHDPQPCPLDNRTHRITQIKGLTHAVPDLTGDDRDDYLIYNVNEGRTDLMAGPFPGTRHASFSIKSEFPRTVDIDRDGDLDLVLIWPWSSTVTIFLSPIPASDIATNPKSFASFTHRTEGLANRFGDDTQIADVTGDGIDDVIIGSSAEGEEACFGTDDTVIFVGPFAPGEYQADDAEIRIPHDENDCFGSPIYAGVKLDDVGRQMVSGKPSLVIGSRKGFRWFTLPLTAGKTPTVAGKFTSGFKPGTDLDGDEFLDMIFPSGIVYGNQQKTSFSSSMSKYHTLVAFGSVDWSTQSPDIIYGVQRWPETGDPIPEGIQPLETMFRRYAKGLTTFEEFPEIGKVASFSYGSHASSTGDLDGDGLKDLVIGEFLIHCAP